MAFIELEAKLSNTAAARLYSVWIDLNCGVCPADWAENTHPKSLEEAIAEYFDLQRRSWIAKIEPA